MVFRRLHLGTVAYGMDSMDEVQSLVFNAYTQVQRTKKNTHKSPQCSGSFKEKQCHLDNKRLKFLNHGKG